MVRAIKISPKACDNSQPGAAHQSHVCSDNERPLELITLPARPPQTPPQRGRAQPPAQGRAAGDGAGDVGVLSPSGPQRWGGATPWAWGSTAVPHPHTLHVCGRNKHGARAGHDASRSCRCSRPSVLQTEARELGGAGRWPPQPPARALPAPCPHARPLAIAKFTSIFLPLICL